MKRIAARHKIFVLVSFLLLFGSTLGAKPRFKVDEDLIPRKGDFAARTKMTAVNLVNPGQPSVTASEKDNKKVVAVPIEGPPVVRTDSRTIRVVIDAGHGGKDLGAPGHSGILEKNLCLRISQLVRRELERLRNTTGIPVEIFLTREDDTFIPLKERVKAANDWGADLFVSIHGNSSPLPRVRGFEVYFLATEGSDEDARRLALMENAGAALPMKASVLSILSDAQTNFHIGESSQFAETMFSAISRRVLSSGRGVRQGPFTVIAGTSMPAVLVEVGYVTNKDEAKLLSKESYLKRLAGAISTGIVEFAARKKRIE